MLVERAIRKWLGKFRALSILKKKSEQKGLGCVWWVMLENPTFAFPIGFYCFLSVPLVTDVILTRFLVSRPHQVVEC